MRTRTQARDRAVLPRSMCMRTEARDRVVLPRCMCMRTQARDRVVLPRSMCMHTASKRLIVVRQIRVSVLRESGRGKGDQWTLQRERRPMR
jgi:hypothetical protein